MDLVKAAQIVGVMLSPTLVIGAALHAPRAFRAVRARLVDRSTDPMLTPTNPPIEELAADLRRLLLRHEALKRSPKEAMRVRRLVALEAAISDCATDAARALGVPHLLRPARGALPIAQLRHLLRGLMDAGLVLPPDVDLVAADRRGPEPGVAHN
jgi:hypothetical protein